MRSKSRFILGLPLLTWLRSGRRVKLFAVANHGRGWGRVRAHGEAQESLRLLSRPCARHTATLNPVYLKEGSLEHDLSTLKLSATADDSKAINNCPGPCLVMAGAGMCTAGRILHHLRFNLGNPEAHVVIVGFQARGSLGRRLVDGAKKVTILGEPIVVRAQIHTLGGFSAHAGQTDLLKWFEVIAPAKPRVILTHGENGPRTILAKLIAERFGVKPLLPTLGEVIEL